MTSPRGESLRRALQLLTLFTEQRPTWRMADLAVESGLPLSSLYKVVATLTSVGYLEHLPDGQYRPGVKVLVLGKAALSGNDLVTVSSPLLRELAFQTCETVSLAVLQQDQILYLVRHCNADLASTNIQVGSTLPAQCTSIGRLLLSRLDDAEAGRSQRRRALVQEETSRPGLRSVVVPVRVRGVVAAAVSIEVHAKDWSMPRVRRELLPLLVETGNAISVTLAGQPNEWSS